MLGTPITQEVLEAGRKAVPALAGLIERVVARLAAADGSQQAGGSLVPDPAN